MGSWNTMAKVRPRRAQSRFSFAVSRSWPSSRIRPLAVAVWGSRPMTANAVIDFPQPDSPTRPRLSPASRTKETRSRMRAGPRGVAMVTVRS